MNSLFAHGHWSFLGRGSEKKWYGTHMYKPNGERDRVAGDMVINFSESGHPVFRRSGVCNAKEEGNCLFISVVTTTDHFRQSAQCCLRGAADMCEELDWRMSGCSESAANLVLITIRRPC